MTTIVTPSFHNAQKNDSLLFRRVQLQKPALLNIDQLTFSGPSDKDALLDQYLNEIVIPEIAYFKQLIEEKGLTELDHLFNAFDEPDALKEVLKEYTVDDLNGLLATYGSESQKRRRLAMEVQLLVEVLVFLKKGISDDEEESRLLGSRSFQLSELRKVSPLVSELVELVNSIYIDKDIPEENRLARFANRTVARMYTNAVITDCLVKAGISQQDILEYVRNRQALYGIPGFEEREKLVAEKIKALPGTP